MAPATKRDAFPTPARAVIWFYTNSRLLSIHRRPTTTLAPKGETTHYDLCVALLLHPLLSLTHWIFRSLMLPYKSSSHSANHVRCARQRRVKLKPLKYLRPSGPSTLKPHRGLSQSHRKTPGTFVPGVYDPFPLRGEGAGIISSYHCPSY